MGFLQKFHLVIRYKKGIYNKVVDMLSRTIVSATTLFKHNYFLHESYIDNYALDDDYQYVYARLSQGKQVEELDTILERFVFQRDKQLTS